jgi:hypothetical protein
MCEEVHLFAPVRSWGTTCLVFNSWLVAAASPNARAGRTGPGKAWLKDTRRSRYQVSVSQGLGIGSKSHLLLRLVLEKENKRKKKKDKKRKER